MPNFAYVARSRTGEELTGFLAGSSLDEVVSHLHGQGLAVLHVVEDRARADRRPWRERLPALRLGRTGTRDLALFSRQFATVLEAGIPMVRGLRGLASDTASPILSHTLSDVADRIERGESLSEALAAHPESFSVMYVSMVRAGERSGTLDQIVDQLAIYLEKVDAVKTKVRAALAYPVFVLAFALLVMLFLLLKIVPTFEHIYRDFAQQLPALTRLVVSLSNVVRNHLFLSIAGAISLVVFVLVALRTREGRHAVDGFLLRVPIFGPIVRKAVMSRVSRTFGILLKSGLPILEGLDLVAGSAGNSVVARAVQDVRRKVAGGRGITESFRSTGKFPEMVLQLMATGEESGDLDSMLIKSSDFYDRQVEASVHSLTSLIEPLMIILVGGMIGTIIVSMFLPIFHLGDAIMRGGYNF
jgi:type IV pilus assembly protein PilC